MRERIRRAAHKTKQRKPGRYADEDSIVRFVRDVLGVEDLAPYQADILQAFVRHKRVSVRGPHGIGKTAIAAWIVLWIMTVFDDDTKVPTTASAWRQLTHFLWPEIRKWASRANWHLLGIEIRRNKELLERSFRLPGKEAFAVASSDAALIEGAHATVLAYVFDEAKAIPIAIWDAAEGAFSGAGGDTDATAYALAISTPGEPAGRFYDIHSRKPGYEDWWVRHVTLEEAIAAGRISREWADQRGVQWGENSAVYQNRVLGEFAESADDAVIPLAWVELANERWRAVNGTGPEDGKVGYGVDPARYGEDKTSTAKLVGNVCEWITYHAKQDTMQTAGRVAAMITKTTPVGIDVIGIGAGVYDRLNEQGYKKAKPVNVAESTSMKDSHGQLEFVNLRSAIWWGLRDALDPTGDEPMALPPDDILTGDLTAPHWTYTSSGKIKVEGKPEIRKRIGRSTDGADALGLAWYVTYTRPMRYPVETW